MAARFPGLEADDLIQEAFIAVARALPDYRYDPEETGRFRNFLTGILAHKAFNALRSEGRRAEREKEYSPEDYGAREEEERTWREAVYALALQQLMANPDIPERSKQILRRTAIDGEKPQKVADSLSVSRDVVDQTKKRMIGRLREIVERLKEADEI